METAGTAHHTVSIESFKHCLWKALLSVFTSLWRERDTGRDDMTRWMSSVESDKNNRAVKRNHLKDKTCTLWCCPYRSYVGWEILLLTRWSRYKQRQTSLSTNQNVPLKVFRVSTGRAVGQKPKSKVTATELKECPCFTAVYANRYFFLLNCITLWINIINVHFNPDGVTFDSTKLTMQIHYFL